MKGLYSIKAKSHDEEVGEEEVEEEEEQEVEEEESSISIESS